MSLEVRNFGAVGDGATLDTGAIQQAIDTCSRNGGGSVCIGGGRFVTGTLYLKDGVPLEIAGGSIQNLAFSNLVMENVPRPVFVALCRQRAGDDAPAEMPPYGVVRNLSFDQITVDNAASGNRNTAFFVSGFPGHDLEAIRFSQISMVGPGGVTAAEAAGLTMMEFDDATLNGWWPDIHILEGQNGILPCYGFFARHVRRLTLDQAEFTTVSPDARLVYTPYWRATATTGAADKLLVSAWTVCFNHRLHL